MWLGDADACGVAGECFCQWWKQAPVAHILTKGAADGSIGADGFGAGAEFVFFPRLDKLFDDGWSGSNVGSSSVERTTLAVGNCAGEGDVSW